MGCLVIFFPPLLCTLQQQSLGIDPLLRALFPQRFREYGEADNVSVTQGRECLIFFAISSCVCIFKLRGPVCFFFRLLKRRQILAL